MGLKPNLVFKYKNYTQLAQSDVWIKYLKPDLLRIKEREAYAEGEPLNEFEAVKRDIKRANSLRIISEIISLLEKAENKIKPYGGKIQADDDGR